ncbi:hypothetical protein FD754_010477 [Muntiacus muntjak]|uniref:MIF4G domain-containing protein n=1 Tax=Muntiacus muntjak TaxID=9888 RepID=A0A5N3WXI2_MUNMU|nr:hypothetical protein FD754_010477 [Muntiacus muntjak]
MEHHSAVKKEQLWIHAITWMDRQGIILSEKSQSHWVTCLDFLPLSHQGNPHLTILTPPQNSSRVLTTGSPGKSLFFLIIFISLLYFFDSTYKEKLFNEKIFINFNGKMIHLTPNPRYPQIFRDTKLSSYDVENTIRAKQHFKKLFIYLTLRQQRPPGGNKPQQHGDHPPGSAKHNRDHQKSYQGGSAPHPSGRSSHHGYSQNRRWHHSNMEHPSGDKGKAGAHRNAKETVPTESPRLEDALGDAGHGGLESPRSPDALAPTASERLTLLQPGCPEAETKLKDSIIPERGGERPKITLLQSSKDRLRRRLKEKVPDEVAVETTSPQQNKMDKLIEILNSMRNNSSDVDAKLTTFMEEAQNSTNSEEMLGEIVRTIYQKAVSDRSFAFTAAKLCDKMALFMVEGTKFRSLLLNMLQDGGHTRPRTILGDSRLGLKSSLLLLCTLEICIENHLQVFLKDGARVIDDLDRDISESQGLCSSSRRPAGKGSWPQGSPEILPGSGFSSSDLWLEWPCSQCPAEHQPWDVLSLKQSPLAPYTPPLHPRRSGLA